MLSSMNKPVLWVEILFKLVLTKKKLLKLFLEIEKHIMPKIKDYDQVAS